MGAHRVTDCNFGLQREFDPMAEVEHKVPHRSPTTPHMKGEQGRTRAAHDFQRGLSAGPAMGLSAGPASQLGSCVSLCMPSLCLHTRSVLHCVGSNSGSTGVGMDRLQTHSRSRLLEQGQGHG